MLSHQTRREVRGPFAISFIQEKVQTAKKKYEELLPQVEEQHERLCARFALAMGRVGPGSNRHEEYCKVLKAFDSLRSDLMDGFRGYHLRSYEETLRFLGVTAEQAQTIMLSQSEFLALGRDDSALSTLQSTKKELDEVQDTTASYGVGATEPGNFH